MERIRGFEPVSEKFQKNDWDNGVILPVQGSKHSAGYDFVSPIDFVVPAHGRSEIIMTDVKAYMLEDEVLEMHVRSSLGFKKGLILSNATGIIDSDYYSNLSNDGNIGIRLVNTTDEDVKISKGERIVQGIFQKFLRSDNGNIEDKRIGGIGSTGER